MPAVAFGGGIWALVKLWRSVDSSSYVISAIEGLKFSALFLSDEGQHIIITRKHQVQVSDWWTIISVDMMTDQLRCWKELLKISWRDISISVDPSADFQQLFPISQSSVDPSADFQQLHISNISIKRWWAKERSTPPPNAIAGKPPTTDHHVISILS